MRRSKLVLAPLSLLLAGSCLPAGSGGGPSGGAAFVPDPDLAPAEKITRFLGAANAQVDWYLPGNTIAHECAWVGVDITGSPATIVSAGPAFLRNGARTRACCLTSRAAASFAQIIAFDGPGEYRYGCGI